MLDLLSMRIPVGRQGAITNASLCFGATGRVGKREGMLQLSFANPVGRPHACGCGRRKGKEREGWVGPR